MIHELSHHAVPLARVFVQCTVLPIFHQSHLIAEAEDARELSQQVDTVALKTVVPIQRLVRFLKHHIWLFLHRKINWCRTVFYLILSCVFVECLCSHLFSVYQYGGYTQGFISKRVCDVGCLAIVSLCHIQATGGIPCSNLLKQFV